jgi:hypothetical protein
VELQITPVSGRPMTEEKHRMIARAALPMFAIIFRNNILPAAAKEDEERS